MKDIDDNLDEIKKEKEEFYSMDINKSTYTNKINDGKGAYTYSHEDVERIEKINNGLMRIAPMLPPADTSDLSKIIVLCSKLYRIRVLIKL
jgi:ADP-ribosylglycohydrolase